jgi:hypothetical protein
MMKAAVAVIVAVSAMLGALAPLSVPPAPFPQMAGIAPSPSQAPSVPESLDALEIMRSIRPCFLENDGQLGGSDVLLYAVDDGMSVGFRRGGVVMVLEDRPATSPEVTRSGPDAKAPEVLGVAFEGCRDVAPVGVDEVGYPTNFLVGNDHSKWVRGARSFREVVYEELWDGVDLRYYFKDGMLKYDLVVSPGASVENVVMRYANTDGLTIEPASGDLVITTRAGLVLRDLAPVAFQDLDGRRVSVACSLALMAGERTGLTVGPYDRTHTLVIDPGLLYSTFLGGTGNDYPFDVQRGYDGCVYVCGATDGPGFLVTAGAYDTVFNLGELLVVKLDSELMHVVYATYCGGRNPRSIYESPPTRPQMMTVRSNGSLLITGDTVVDDLPVTPDAVRSAYDADTDGFILALSPDGGEVEYCSYFGGAYWDGHTCHHLTTDGELYLVGSSGSGNLPTTPGAFQESMRGLEDIYIAKLDASFSTIVFCTYFGGSKSEELGALRPFAVDGDGNLHLTGKTDSTDLQTTPDAFCRTVASVNQDTFVLKMDKNASRVIYCTYLGGQGRDWPYLLSVRPDGSMAVVGYTFSSDFPVTADCLDDELSGTIDCFLSVLDIDAPRLAFSTYLGGDGKDTPVSGTYDRATDVFHLAGYTTSTDLATTPGCYDPDFRGSVSDLFVMSVDLGARSLAYCTYLGEAAADRLFGPGMLVEDEGSLLLVASTFSASFPTTSKALDRSYNGGSTDGVLLVLDPHAVEPPPPPGGVSLEAGDGYVTINWSAVLSESYVTTGYVLLKGEDPSTPTAINVKGLNYTDWGVENGVTYYYRVAARNSAGAGPPSEAQEARPMGVPSEPLGLTLTTGDGTVHLAWSPPATTRGGQLLGYHVWRGDGLETVRPLKLLGNVTSWTDEGVTVGERYYYQVVAFNERGNGTASEAREVTVTSPPGAPVSLTATAGPGRVDLAWEAPSQTGGAPLLGFLVLRGLPVGSMIVIRTMLPGELSHTDSDVVNGTTYLYGVRAFTMVNESALAGPLSATPYGPPGAPAGLEASPGDGQVLLEWSPPVNDGGRPLTGYRVYAGPSTGGLTLRSSTMVVTSHYLSGLANGEEVLLAVAAVNEMGEGPMSAIVGATPYGPPSRPRDFNITIGAEGVMLGWTVPERLGGASSVSYRVERGPSPTALGMLAMIDGTTDYLDMTVARGSTYYYRVLAINPLGNPGEPTETLVAAVPGLPGPVGELTARPGDGIVHLSWAPPADDGGAPVLNYTVLRGIGDAEVLPYAVVSGSTAFDDEDVVNGQTYRYSVSAANLMGAGPQATAAIATPMDRPPAPWDLRASVEGASVRLTWSAPLGQGAPVTGYIIFRGTGKDDLTPVAELGDVREFTDKDVAKGRTYYYSVAANSSVGEGDRSQALEVAIGGGTGTILVLAIVLLAMVAIAMVAVMRWRRGHGRPKE